jgi:YtkA-like
MTGLGRRTTARRAAVLVLVLLGGAGCATAIGQRSASQTPDGAMTAALPPVSPSTRPTGSATATPSANVRNGVHSDRGMFVGSWSSVPGDPPINVVHEWVLHIETSDGEPVEGAMITVDGDMPAHGHGMPTRPEVTAELGGGDYRVEGMSFQMGGYWIVDVTITAGGETDLIRFGLEL